MSPKSCTQTLTHIMHRSVLCLTEALWQFKNQHLRLRGAWNLQVICSRILCNGRQIMQGLEFRTWTWSGELWSSSCPWWGPPKLYRVSRLWVLASDFRPTLRQLITTQDINITKKDYSYPSLISLICSNVSLFRKAQSTSSLKSLYSLRYRW